LVAPHITRIDDTAGQLKQFKGGKIQMNWTFVLDKSTGEFCYGYCLCSFDLTAELTGP
jgi:hypothetical protein